MGNNYMESCVLCRIGCKYARFDVQIIYWRKIMKRLLSVLVAMSAVGLSSSAMANMELAKSKNCMACHAIDTKLVGPAYKTVAKKYAGQKDAEAKLVDKVMKGGKGVWGEIPMPPNTQVSKAEAETLVKWILSLK